MWLPNPSHGGIMGRVYPARWLVTSLAVAFLLAADIAGAQTAPSTQSEPKKIALVLEGGGALGFAHVGVLEVLEKYNICPDAVAGTSMGAIVGGLYSSGYSPSELRMLSETIDWAGIFDDSVPRQDLSYRRKQDDSNFLAKARVGVRDGSIRSPLGLIQGEDLTLQLRELLETRSQVSDFDKLPIPFRAVAVDLLTGEPLALRDGNLATAMRASMSVPGAFPPVRVNDRLLVDGGIADNLPVRVALEEFEPDHIIAVRLLTAPVEEASFTSAVSVLGQMVGLMLADNVQRSLDLLKTVPHTLIEVDLRGYGSTSFDKASELVGPGVSAAEQLASELRVLANFDQAPGIVASGTAAAEDVSGDLRALSRSSCPRRPAPPGQPVIAFIDLENTSPLSDDILVNRLGVEVGDTLDPEQLRAGLKSIYGLGLFDLVDYQVVTRPGGQTGIKVIATEKSTGLTSLRFGLNLENNFRGQTAYNIATEVSFLALNSLGGESRSEVILGDDLSVFTEFFQPLQARKNYFFVRPRAGYRAYDVPVFGDGNRIAEYRVGFGAAALDVGYQIDSLGEVSVSAYSGWGSAEVETGDPTLPDLDVDIRDVIARVEVDRLDQLSFPQDGFRATMSYRRSLESVGASSDYGIVNASGFTAHSFGSNTVIAGIDAQYTGEGTNSVESRALLGGLFNLSGLERNEIAGEHSFLGRVGYFRNVTGGNEGLLNLPIYVGTTAEAGQVYESREAFRNLEDITYGGSAWLGVDTPIGPLYLAYGHAEGGRQSAYLFLGRSF